MIEQYVPLMRRENNDEPVDGESFLDDANLEKSLEDNPPKWFRASKWTFLQFSSWTRDDVKTLTVAILSFVVMLLPRYLRRGGLDIKKKLHPTSYLDALRGWAALSVFRFHGFTNRTYFLDQQVVRGVMNGRAMVSLFFVISGYVLGYRMLKMIRNRQTSLLGALASSTFRRWFRLYASTGVATLISSMMLFTGMISWPLDHKKDNVLAQLWDWFKDFIIYSDPFGSLQGWWSYGIFCTAYLGQMWTIPVEFRGSMVLFWFCASSAYLSDKGRRIFCGALIFLFYCWGVIDIALFLWGLLIADFSFDRHPERLGSGRPAPRPDDNHLAEQRQSWREKIFYMSLVVLGFFLFGQPAPPYPSATGWLWPWEHLTQVPVSLGYIEGQDENFWLSIGAVLMVYAIDNCRMLQIPLEWRFSQYLGDLSFGIYAMHTPILGSMHEKVMEPWRREHLPDYWLDGLPGMIVTTLTLLWVADYFTRIDTKVVQIGRVIEQKTFIKWEQ